MAHPALSHHRVTRWAASVAPSLWLVLGAAAALALAGVVVSDTSMRLVLLASALTLVSLAVVMAVIASQSGRRRAADVAQIARFVENDASPSFTTDDAGQIVHQNRAALERFGERGGVTFLSALGDLFANPSAVIYRLQSRAAATGAAREDVVTRRGHVRLSVHRIGDNAFLWRLEEMMDRSASVRGAETLSLPMLTSSRSGTILFMNEAMRRLVGGRVRTLDQVFASLPLNSGAETEIRTATGTIRAIVADFEGAAGRHEVFLLPVGQGAIGPPVDVSALESLPVALIRLAADGQVREANRLARELLHLSPDDRPRLSDLVDGPGRPLSDWLADALAGRAAGRPEVLRARRGTGDPFLHVTLRPAVDPSGGETGLVAVLTDATALKSLEAQVMQSQKMQAIGQLAGGVAHDFNNLLTAISGHCDLLLLRHDAADPDHADLMQIRQNGNRAAALVAQLLAFSRKQTLEPEVIGIAEALGDLTHLLNRLVGERIALSLSVATDLPPIRADRRQFEQVLMNLVVNARDAMPDGGEIRVEAAPVALAAATRHGRAMIPPGDYVLIRVIDSGTGIPPDIRDKIFEPFFTTKRPGEGTGLGLSTAYGIVKQTGGFIFAEDGEDGGTVFALWFPALVPTEEPAAEVQPPALRRVTAGMPRQRRPGAADPMPGPRTPSSGSGARSLRLSPSDVPDAGQDTPPDLASALPARGRRPSAPPDPVSAEGADSSAAAAFLDGGADGAPEPGPLAAAGMHDGAFGTHPQEDTRAAVRDPGRPDVLQPPAPREAALSRAPIEMESPSRDDPPDPVILLVEDEAPVRAFASRALRMRGFTVLEAANAEDALETLRDRRLRVDLFLTDVVMPGLNGPDWVRTALRDRPDVRVVFVSGYAEDAVSDARRDIPNSVFLPKPFSLRDLTATVEAQLG